MLTRIKKNMVGWIIMLNEREKLISDLTLLRQLLDNVRGFEYRRLNIEFSESNYILDVISLIKE